MMGNTALVYAASDGKHRPASHPARQRHGWIEPTPRVIPKPPPEPIVRVLVSPDPKALRRRREADRKRERWHTDPEYRERQKAYMAAYRRSERGKQKRAEATRREAEYRRAHRPIRLPMTPEEARRRAAEAKRRKYATDPEFRERRKADQRRRDQAKRERRAAA